MSIEVRKSSKSSKCNKCGQGIKRGDLYANDFVTLGWGRMRHVSAGKFHLACADCDWASTVVSDDYAPAVCAAVGVEPVKESEWLKVNS